MSFPHEIEESGYVDGLNDVGILARLVLPLSKAVLSTIGLFYAVGIWNAFFTPFLYLDKQELYPLQLILRDIVMQGSNVNMKLMTNQTLERDKFVVEEALKYSAIIVSMLPVIIVYPFLQKYFVKGVMIGAIKG